MSDILRGVLSAEQQREALAVARGICDACPPVRPTMRRGGHPFRLRHAAAGVGCWHSDERGYRYTRNHPINGTPLPPLPEFAEEWWHMVHAAAGLDVEELPNHCGVLVYGLDGRLGEHVDKQERSPAPIVTLSLGASAVVMMRAAAGKAHRHTLDSGDAMILAGMARTTPHAVERIIHSPLVGRWGLPPEIRVSITLRKVSEVSEQ